MSDETIYDFEVETLRGEKTTLDDVRGKVALIVNTASKCGLTPQFEGLEALYQEYRDQGLVVLGFPCNQFAGQEPGSADEIANFCQANYGVSFPMFAKIDVNGEGAHPLYRFLKSQQKGLLGSETIKWNFTKFLIDSEGKVVERFAPTTTPDKIAPEIEKLLPGTE